MMKLLSLLFFAFSVSTSSATSLRGSRNLQADSFVLCRMVVIDTQFEDESVEVEAACVPIVDGKETDEVITIPSMPSSISNNELLATGKMFVNITDAQLLNRDIAVTPNTHFHVIKQLPGHLRYLEDVNTWTHGTKTVAFVLVSTTDVSPTVTEGQLENLFNDNNVNFRTQYDKCSGGKIAMEMSDVGVVEVTLDNPMSEYGTRGGPLVSEAEEKLRARFDTTDLSSLADKVVFCVAQGPGTWVASAPSHHWRAQFHDTWCLSLTAMMHELGHTIGAQHAFENGEKYADTCGNMARSYRQETTPQRCFDARNNLDFGWYDDRTVEITPSANYQETIKLAGFVEYAKAKTDEAVLISVEDEILIQYNLAKAHHIGSGEKRNMITVANKTELLAGLDEGDRFEFDDYHGSGRTLVVQACQKTDGDDSQADLFEVIVGMGNVQCPVQSAERQTPSPTTPLPVVESREKETVFPTAAQINPPTKSPTSAPTKAPTSSPTKSPTKAPTDAPSQSPTRPVVQSNEKANDNSAFYNRYNALHQVNRNDSP